MPALSNQRAFFLNKQNWYKIKVKDLILLRKEGHMKNTVFEWMKSMLPKVEKSKKERTLTEFLQESLRESVKTDELAYTEATKARTIKEMVKAFTEIKKARTKAEKEALDGSKELRKKGWLEQEFDVALNTFLSNPNKDTSESVMRLVTQLEVNRRVRFLYDIQRLRIAADNRCNINEKNFGIKDLYLDYSGEVLNRLEEENIKMIDAVMGRSADAGFYGWLKSTYLGVGPQMAACIIAELSTPKRFRNVSALWAYCGLHVVGNDETGFGGHAAKREAGQPSNWNTFLKTKMLGVLADIMIKHQTKHLGPDFPPNKANYLKKLEDYKSGKRENPPEDIAPLNEEKSRNIKVLVGYKARLHQINEKVSERERFYTEKGSEIFKKADKLVKGVPQQIEVFSNSGKSKGYILASTIKRRTPAHIDAMAKRYMIKMFLCDILNKWREFEGMPALLTYDEAKLRDGVKHGENPYATALERALDVMQ
jgi:hypothetical protein